MECYTLILVLSLNFFQALSLSVTRQYGEHPIVYLGFKFMVWYKLSSILVLAGS